MLEELLAKAPSEAWVGLLGVVIGALLSIFGAWLTSRSSIAQLHIQLEHEERLQNKTVKRERLEELYVLLGHWSSAIFGNYLSLTLVMKGEMNYNDYLDRVVSNGEKNLYDFKRLEMIIDVYGHELKPEYEKVLAARTKRNEIETAHKLSYKAGELEARRFLSPFSEAQIELENLTENLRKKAAELARNA